MKEATARRIIHAAVSAELNDAASLKSRAKNGTEGFSLLLAGFGESFGNRCG